MFAGVRAKWIQLLCVHVVPSGLWIGCLFPDLVLLVVVILSLLLWCIYHKSVQMCALRFCMSMTVTLNIHSLFCSSIYFSRLTLSVCLFAVFCFKSCALRWMYMCCCISSISESKVAFSRCGVQGFHILVLKKWMLENFENIKPNFCYFSPSPNPPLFVCVCVYFVKLPQFF